MTARCSKSARCDVPALLKALKKRSGQDKHMKTRRITVVIGAWLVFLAAPVAASAQENFPNRPVRIVVPYSPGSVTDVFEVGAA